MNSRWFNIKRALKNKKINFAISREHVLGGLSKMVVYFF